MLEMKVPSPGESITEVEIATWLVKDGDYVEKGQAIAEVDSDKATLELPAEEAGIIYLKAEEGDVEMENVEDEDNDTPPFDVDDFENEESGMEVDFIALRTEIRNLNKSGTPEQKKAVKAILTATGMKLDQIEDIAVLTQMLEVFE